MNIGIIAFSQSGNTESVARKIEESFSSTAHNVKVDMITVKGEVKPEIKKYKFGNKPEVDQYDFLIFASSVQAFSLNSVMKYYLNQLDSLEKKRFFSIVTKALPFNWTGGTRAIKQMKEICKSKGAENCGNGIVHWREKTRSADINEVLCKVKQAVKSIEI